MPLSVFAECLHHGTSDGECWYMQHMGNSSALRT